MSEQELVQLFEKLGAQNPAHWAHSQANEGIPQVARFLFLRQAWKLVVRTDDRGWIREHMDVDPKGPGGAIGPARQRLTAQGVGEQDLTTIVRVMQWRLLSALCYLLEDPGDVEDEVKDVAWRLFQVNGEGQPMAVISRLHESVLETDPSGRQMRS